MAPKKATSTRGSGSSTDAKKKYQRPKDDAERMLRKRFRRIRSCRFSVYEVPPPEKLAAFQTWAIVRQNPEIVREQKKIITDPESRWWIPLVMSKAEWRQLYWLDIVEFKIKGKLWPTMCRACDNKLICGEEGMGTSLRHECRASTDDLVKLKKKKDVYVKANGV